MKLPSDAHELSNFILTKFTSDILGSYSKGFISTAPELEKDAKRAAQDEGLLESIALLVTEKRDELELNAATDDALRRFIRGNARLAGKRAGRTRIGKRAIASTIAFDLTEPVATGERSVLDQIVARRNEIPRASLKNRMRELTRIALANVDPRDRCVWTEKNEDKRKWEGVRRKRAHRWKCDVTVVEVKERYFRAQKLIGEKMRTLAEEYFS